MAHLGRREFIGLLGGAAAWPLAAGAQQPTMPVIGFLSSRSPGESTGLVAAFRRGLGESGFAEGQNIIIAFRWAEGHYERLSTLASDLVALPVAAIVAAGGVPPIAAAKAVTSTIPIVFSGMTDPVGLGFVASLKRPGGNVTGMSLFNNDLLAKRLGLLHELVSKAAIVGLLVNPKTPILEVHMRDVKATAQSLGLELHVLNASTAGEISAAFGTLDRLRAGAIIVQGEPSFDAQREHIVALAAHHKLPAIYAWREYIAAGGLMSYGTSLTENYRQVGVYIGRILKGEKPADLPVIQPTKFELVINVKTARTLGLDVPANLIAITDEVIE